MMNKRVRDEQGRWIPSTNHKRFKDSYGKWLPSPKLITFEEKIVAPWLNLYLKYKGVKCSKTEDYRSFKAWVGVTPDVAEMIFTKYNDPFGLPSRDRLLIVLNFLKCMPSQDDASVNFGISRPTYRKYLWGTLFHLNKVMNEVCSVGNTKYCISN